ncbi:MAG TPA: lipopolysaccharide biosynthesis protein [Lysobacter sp.]|nr:lipopolysaccharide biosynthesis protein [Lysobacter sp.]
MPGWLALFAALAAVSTWFVRGYALQRRLVDAPGERRSHTVATPRGGGAAIVVAVLVAAIALSMRFPAQATLLRLFASGFAMVALVGWIDDHRPTSPWLRLGVHALAAGVLAVGLALAHGDFRLALGAFVLAVVLTNVWNFMDGINGIAATQALLVASALAWATGGAWGWLGAALAAACAGFLPFNFPRARIFLGDVGSGALGFALAALGAAAGAQWALEPVLVLMLLSAFLVDAGLTLLRRILRRERWWTAHAQHAYQAWARRNGHTRVTLAYAGWTVAAVTLALMLQRQPAWLSVVGVTAWYTCAALLWWWIQRRSA